VTGALAALGCVLAIGCENLSGTRAQQGALIGGVAGAGVGAAVNDENRLLGALIGGALGAGGGYLVGANTEWFGNPDSRDRVRDSVGNAQASPATTEDVDRSSTADLNLDGFVTTDELIAMERAGLSDDQILQRLRATHQVFDLNASQERTLAQAGVSQRVLREMPEINRLERDRILGSRV
jgi:hypothetical protein